MAYTVLARRYRSQSFDDVVGQEPIARTLRNAIIQNRVAHAYLFTGTRGVGKTSMARIFARALNAPDTIPDAPKPPDAEFPELDVQQRMADAIMRGEDLNVIEIDGASNNSVDNARQLIASAGLSPTGNARYKVYIIDEVHMLSGAAFNALLKTMEEPPSHVKFILCTTEPHKVPATIQSRCQRFDFRNIPTRAIAEHLKAVLAKEGIKAEDEVVFQVGVLGNGSMRDALSLLDRLTATGESPLTAKTLEEMLGLPNQQLVADLVDALADGDAKATLEKTAELLSRGISQDQLIEVLIDRLRQLMLIAACGPDSELVELSDSVRQSAAQQAQRFDAAALVHMIALCENLQRHGKASANPRALLDATVVRLALAEKMADVSALLGGRALPGDGGSKKKVAGDRGQGPEIRDQLPGEAGFSTPVGEQGSGVRDQGSGTNAAPSPIPHPPSAIPNDPAAVWAALLERVGSIPSMAYADHLVLKKLDGDVATLTPLPGHRDAARFADTENRRKRLADELMAILGRRVRVQIVAPEANAADVGVDEASPTGPDAPKRPGVSVTDRRAAMELPLVRDAIEMFPDAVPIEVRAGNEQESV